MARTAAEFHPMHARRRPVRRQRIRLFLAVIRVMLFFGFFGAVGYAFLLYLIESPRLLVQDIPVTGTSRLSVESIQEATGVTGETNLLLVNPSEVARAVAALPEVRTAHVRRDFPATLLVSIEERTPVLTLLVNNHAFLVDDDGVVLRVLNQLEPYTGPLVTQVPNLSALEPGQRIQEPAFREVLKLWKAFQSVPVSQLLEVSEIAAPDPDELMMVCKDVPFALVWGRSNYEHQAKRFDYLWRREEGALPCLYTLDLRFETDLVCR